MTTTPFGQSAIPTQRGMTLSDQVAEEIRAMLGRRRWSQARLARALERSEMWVSDRMRGKQPIDLNDLQLIANALEVPVGQLLPPVEKLNTREYRSLVVERPPTRPKLDITPDSRRRPKLTGRALTAIPRQRAVAGVTL